MISSMISWGIESMTRGELAVAEQMAGQSSGLSLSVRRLFRTSSVQPERPGLCRLVGPSLTAQVTVTPTLPARCRLIRTTHQQNSQPQPPNTSFLSLKKCQVPNARGLTRVTKMLQKTPRNQRVRQLSLRCQQLLLKSLQKLGITTR